MLSSMTEEGTDLRADVRASDGQPVLEMRDVSKRFGEIQALDDVSLELIPGEIHALLGENGAGKSTLIKVMTGVVQPDIGDIYIDGEKVHIGSAFDAQTYAGGGHLPGAHGLPRPDGGREHLHRPSRPRAHRQQGPHARRGQEGPGAP